MLIQAVLEDVCYYAEMFINTTNSVRRATNNMSMLFTDTAVKGDPDISSGSYGFINADAQVMAYGNPVIFDTVNWIKISGFFTAEGGEQFLTIGNFKPDSLTSSVLINEDAYGSGYYIDAVSVVPVDSLTTLDLAGPDTSVVAGDSVYIGTLTSGMPEVQWYSSTGEAIAYGVPGIKVSPASDAYYVVEASVCGKVFRDTVSVVVKPVGVEEVNARNEFVIFPNPTRGEINIDLPQCSEGEYQLKVTDVNGKILKQQIYPCNAGSIVLQLSGASGVYYIKVVNSATSELFTDKILLQR